VQAENLPAINSLDWFIRAGEDSVPRNRDSERMENGVPEHGNP